jgi:hypothetical protein
VGVATSGVLMGTGFLSTTTQDDPYFPAIYGTVTSATASSVKESAD